ncbi:MAG: ATP-binding protein [SAR202 cluster bacterium]|nr:ATP-binding protein [SAR202 cluster bacterium]MDP6713967.1 ATP-binding protein [SAR202 cluster bacterium]
MSPGGSDLSQLLRYRQLFERSSDAIVMVVDRHIIDANLAAAKMMGMDVKSLIGLETTTFYADESEGDQLRKSFAENGFIQDYSVKLVTPDGRELDCMLTGSATVNPDGNLSTQTIIRDVTEQLRAEALLSAREERLRRLARQNEILASIGQIVSSSADFETVFDTFTGKLGGLVQCDAAVIGLVDLEAQTVTPRYLNGKPGPDWELDRPAPLTDMLLKQAVGSGKTISENGQNVGHVGGDESRVRSTLIAPLRQNNNVFGLLGLFCNQPSAYDQDDEEFVELVADQIAGVVANAQLYARLRDAEELQTHLAQEGAIMAELGRVVSSSLELNDVYERFAELVRFLVPFDRIAISMIEPDLHHLKVAYSAGKRHPMYVDKDVIYPIGPTSQGVMNNRTGILVQGADFERVTGPLREASSVFKSIVIAPLIADDSVIGLLFISSTEENVYALRDLDVVQRVGDQIAGVLEITQLYAHRTETESLLRASASRVQEQAAELSYINSDLMRASKVKSEFLSHMSHELRTPLNVVLGFADLLTEPAFGGLTERQSRFVENITTSGHHLLRLINDTLELSKIQDGLLKLTVGKVDVAACLEECVNTLRSRRSDVLVTTRVDIPEESVFYGDEQRLSQIVRCLLDNAVKFSPTNGQVELSAFTSEAALGISVKDDGIGIDEKYHREIFDLFNQGHPDTSKKYGGSGLGLAFAKQLVDLHEGTLSLESSEGNGSLFTVLLPYRHDAAIRPN